MTFSYCMRMARAYERWEAEDLGQELFIYAWKLGKRGVEEKWVRQKCRWFAIDYYRKRKIRAERFRSLEEMEREPSYKMQESLDLLTENLGSEILKKIFLLKSSGFTIRKIAKEVSISKTKVHLMIKDAISILV